MRRMQPPSNSQRRPQPTDSPTRQPTALPAIRGQTFTRTLKDGLITEPIPVPDGTQVTITLTPPNAAGNA